MDIIHIVLGKANPDRMNGVNKVVHQLATRQAASGRKVAVWGIAADTEHNYPARNFETRLFLQAKRKFAIRKELKKAIANAENTTFHLHGGWIPTFWAVAKCIKKCKKRVVLTPHGAYNTIAMQKSGIAKKVYYYLFEKKVLDTVARIHCIGASEKEGLEKIYPNNKQYLLPYGFQKPATESFTKKSKNQFVIGFVGRIDLHTKGLDLLAQAFAKFSEFKKTHLWIVGDSDEMAALQDLLEKEGVANNTILFGSKYGEEKNEIIKQMDVFTHPSRNEGLPTAVLEAASFGVPSVVTRATNVGSYLEKHHAGHCVPNESVDDLVAAFEKIYAAWQANKINNYINGTQKMLDEEFNWEILVERYDELYV